MKKIVVDYSCGQKWFIGDEYTWEVEDGILYVHSDAGCVFATDNWNSIEVSYE